MDSIELLKLRVDRDAKRGTLLIYLNKLKEKQSDSMISNIWTQHNYLGLKSLFIDKNIEEAKQHFYVCGKLDEYLIKKYDSYLWGDKMRNALLSDNKGLIQSYAHIKNSRYAYDTTRGGVNFQAMQNIIKNDMETLSRSVDTIKKQIPKKKGWQSKFYGLCKLYYESILENDKTQIEDAITQLVEPKFQKKRVLTEINLIDVFATSFAKLAWLRGIEVEIDSPLIPKELLPINPNKTYTMPYDFLK